MPSGAQPSQNLRPSKIAWRRSVRIQQIPCSLALCLYGCQTSVDYPSWLRKSSIRRVQEDAFCDVHCRRQRVSVHHSGSLYVHREWATMVVHRPGTSSSLASALGNSSNQAGTSKYTNCPSKLCL
ncbi:hypothetical protein SCLCIDRAFT_1225299 [Scleroderma citrinum Foug A]|uniref:Uncharacterized protein n=1 Tax=Scleroderma citrinum Foug A TaxID=1036808 RepID=A0A0C2YLB4_9AGAM|nr:hypothetical protein SCLCIDRAFT_1225299 [Scleroderma citrinum Foug A]